MFRPKARGDNVRTHLYKDERVLLDGFEELAEYVGDERYEILVRLILGEGLLIRNDSFEQVQCGYLAERSAPTYQTHAMGSLGRTTLRLLRAQLAGAASRRHVSSLRVM